MTSRQIRRAAERRERKLQRKAMNGFVFSSEDTASSQPSEPATEFGNAPLQIPEAPIRNPERSDPPARSAATRADINRANAQHSTGPRTSTGKLASCRNSLKHGLASAVLIIPGEDPAAFEALFADLLTEHQPANSSEELLVHEMAQSWWLTQRALRFQNQCFTTEAVDEKRLALFLRYQTTHERAFHKALNTLIRLKKHRAPGFVSQPCASTLPEIGFVSQNSPVGPAPAHFVWQNQPAERHVERSAP